MKSLLLPTLATVNPFSQPEIKASFVGLQMWTGTNLSGTDLSVSGPFVARFPISPKRSGWKLKIHFCIFIHDMRPVLRLCPQEFKRMGQSFLLLTYADDSSLQILSSALLEQEWMVAVQPSKLLFLFMITLLSEGNCWCLLFRCSKLVRKGIATCDERYWTEPRYFNKNNP